MVDHRFIKVLIDDVFMASGNTAMNTSDLWEEIKKVNPEITKNQVWQTLNDPRFVGHYIKIIESTKRHLYQIEENCFLGISTESVLRDQQSMNCDEE